MRRSQAINMTGAILTGTVLVIVLLTKFTRGAWIVCVAMPVIFMTMKAIRRHYDRVALELVPDPGPPTLPSRVYAVVLVSKLHRPTLRALAFAKASRPHVLEAITVNIDDKDTEALQEEWHKRGIGIDLVVIDSPFREITRPSSSTCGASAASRRATWSASTSRSTSSATGGRTCCTTRARCG